MTGSGHLTSGQATSMEISAAQVLRFVLCGPALDFRCLSPGQTEVGIPFPVDLPHREALLVKTVHPNHVRGGIVVPSVGGVRFRSWPEVVIWPAVRPPRWRYQQPKSYGLFFAVRHWTSGACLQVRRKWAFHFRSTFLTGRPSWSKLCTPIM